MANLPKLPAAAAHLWTCFEELHATRASNGMGPSRLTRAEIRQWEQDELQHLAHWERKAIMAVDAAWLSAALSDLKAPG